MNAEINPPPSQRDALFHAAAIMADYAKIYHVDAPNLAAEWLEAYRHLLETNTGNSSMRAARPSPPTRDGAGEKGGKDL